MHRRVTQAAAVVAMLALLITGCTSQASNIGIAKDKTNNVVDTGFNVSTVGSYDSADTAVVVSVDSQNNAVTFMNMDAGRQYTLYYDGTTYVQDKYSGPMAISQIKAGDVVDVNFLKGKRQIASIQLSPGAWVYDNIGNYNLGGINKTASIGSATYSLPDDVLVLSGGKRAEVMDIVAQDVISVRGIDHKIYSINVEKGHGYLRLKNDQALIGGWIEVGNTVIREITEDMLLVVPEGSYQVVLSNNGASCIKDVIIERDKEVVLDVGDLEIIQDKTGMILLSVTPDSAKVKIDGKEVDISQAIELSYGIHQVRLEASGYDSLTKYIQVGSEYAKISFTLEETKKPKDDDSYSQNDLTQPESDKGEAPSLSENTISAVSGNRVYIDAPKNVEVYLDSNYIGISPVSFKKKVGSHTITLRKSGYVTKSYTIYLYNDGEDITYSFTDLEKESTTVSGNESSSGSSKSSTETNDGTVSGNESTSSSSSQTTESGNDTGDKSDSAGDDNSDKE
ncbi:MAG: PEGA domain-containing protein [Lachnospiraceae bacterium]|nr:PEGA domain-containing protein [Lachnospiraceae bacterium]